MNFTKINKKVIVASFLAVPILASIISTLHITHFFSLGNPDWMSYFLAITFEVGSIASFVALSVLDKIRKGMVLFIFFVLFILQLAGNVYFSFEYINIKLSQDPAWMNTFIELFKPIYDTDESSTYKFILAMVIGMPIPLVSLSFLKSLVDYLKVDEPVVAEVKKLEVVEEPVKVEEKPIAVLSEEKKPEPPQKNEPVPNNNKRRTDDDNIAPYVN